MNKLHTTGKVPHCPKCGKGTKVDVVGDLWRCVHCKGFFDDNPNEGGDYFADPSKRLERQEARHQGRRRAHGR